MKFRVQKTNREDLVRKIHDTVFDADAFYENKNNYYWIIKNQDKELAGFGILTKWSDDIVFLSRSGVIEEFRGNGLQRRLIKAREKFAKVNGFKSVVTYTKVHNVKSSVSLQKSGYMIYKPEYEYADPDCIYWIKNL